MTGRPSERGIALVAALLVTMMMSAMVAGFLVLVNADQAAGGVDRDQTQAYAAAHAGVEKLTADLGLLFTGNFSPTGEQVQEIAATEMQPNLPGIQFLSPDDSTGYRVTFAADGNGNPTIADPNGTLIAAGPYQGLRGLITPFQVEVTARTTGGAEVRMRREMQTIAIPVFQFGLFSENNLSFFAGPNFSFGGRVHTNQHLFLAQDDNATLTLADRVTAVGEVIRRQLANGMSGTHGGTVRMARAPNCPSAPTAINANCFNIGLSQGSRVTGLTSAINDPTWTNMSVGTSNGWIKNGRTGARRLDLPIVSDGASPVDLIRRPPTGELATSSIGRQRFYNMATLRILLSDQASDLTPPKLPGTVGTPVRLEGSFTPDVVTGGLAVTPHPFAWSTGTLDDGFRTGANLPTIDGYILINRQDRDGNWTDVTREILSLGFSGKRLSTEVIDVANLANNCLDVHPNAVIRVQRVRDTLPNASGGCPTVLPGLVPPSQNIDYWPNVLYDAREGMLRDDQGARPQAPALAADRPPNVAANQPRMYWGGVMHYVELDVLNFHQWVEGVIGSSPNTGCQNGAGGASCPMDITGFVVYFSDRRTNRNRGSDNTVELSYGVNGFQYIDDGETGELGFEDNINPGSASSMPPNDALDGMFVDALGQTRYAEDINARDDRPGNVYTPSLQTYGADPRPVPGMLAIGVADDHTPDDNVYDLYSTPIDRNVARVNRAFFFRRGLKLVNGGRQNLPHNDTQGLTVAAENPVYVQGNYNACNNLVPSLANTWASNCVGGVGFGINPGPTGDHVSAAIIADSVTLLSNAWNDIRSFVNPFNATISNVDNVDSQGKYNARQARPTWFRAAVIAGKGLAFTRPTNNTNDHEDFGNDGGAHNFLRYLENWGGVGLNYTGSLVSFYTSRQAVGTYKCCDNVYGAPSRGYTFDVEFLTPSLLPPRTPMFRDINTLTFRQILRPTQ